VASYPKLVSVVLDGTDIRSLAEFYRQLLGLEYASGHEPPAAGEADPNGEDWLILRRPDGSPQLAFQHVAEQAESTWPDQAVPQQLHLDCLVESIEELDVQHERALALGARLIFDQYDKPEEALRVYADPAGHPFCLFARRG
jgi:catechol 2,3-dioxygenase-like lactoylglutathione lyase family enzyme